MQLLTSGWRWYPIFALIKRPDCHAYKLQTPHLTYTQWSKARHQKHLSVLTHVSKTSVRGMNSNLGWLLQLKYGTYTSLCHNLKTLQNINKAFEWGFCIAFKRICLYIPACATGSRCLMLPGTKLEWKPAILWWQSQLGPVWWWWSLASGWVGDKRQVQHVHNLIPKSKVLVEWLWQQFLFL